MGGEDVNRPARAWLNRAGVGLIVSAIFLTLVLRKVHLAEVVAQLTTVKISFLALAVANKFIAMVVLTWRWQALLRRSHPQRFGVVFKAVVYGFTFNTLLPFRLGEIYRIEYLSRSEQMPRVTIGTTVVVERGLDLAALAVMFYSLSFLVFLRFSSTAYGIVVAGTALLFLLLFLATWQKDKLISRIRSVEPRIGARWAERLEMAIEHFVSGASFLRSGSDATIALVCTVMYWLLNAGSIFLCMIAFGLHLPWYASFLLIVFLFFGVILPAAPGMIGTYDYFCIAGMKTLGVAQTGATSFALVLHAVSFIPVTLLGVLLFLADRKAILPVRPDLKV